MGVEVVLGVWGVGFRDEGLWGLGFRVKPGRGFRGLGVIGVRGLA